MKTSGARFIKNTILTLLVPGVVLVISLGMCAAKGVPFWAEQGGFRAFVYSFVLTVFSAFALGLHLFAGRFDFSLGAVATLSAVLAGRAALAWGLNTYTMLAVILVIGAILGAISGGLYILFNLPPIITSLGVALAYEGLSFGLSKGNGVYLSLKPELLHGADLVPMFVLLAAGLTLMFVLMNFTRFGYNYRAIQFGQKIAVETGLNEKSNAMWCYILCGVMIAVVGYLRLSYNGSQAPLLGLSTSASVFTAMLPLFIGGLLARICEQNISIVLGCLTSTMIQQGLSRVDVSAQARSLLMSLILVLVLVYSTNGQKIALWFRKTFARGAVYAKE
jgi:ribose transport system permease protein